MEQVIVQELETDINAVRDKLKAVDEQIDSLSGRIPRHQRISYSNINESEPLNSVDRSSFGLDDKGLEIDREYRRDTTGGAVRRRVSIEDRINRKRTFEPVSQKRGRADYLDDDDEDYSNDLKRPKKSLSSTVVMPALDSKGRDEKIEKLKENENKEVKSRNRRLFSNLIMGTLTDFKKREKKTQQQEKQEEVEKKLEETKKKDEELRYQEKKELLSKRREQERELQSLQRKKALIQYSEIKVKQLKMMYGTIKTNIAPHIYWQPVKHTVRSMELQQATERLLDDLIKKRNEQLKEELEAREKKDFENDNNDGCEDEYESDGKNEENGDENGIEVVLKNSDDGDDKRTVKIDDDNKIVVEEEMEDEVHVELD